MKTGENHKPLRSRAHLKSVKCGYHLSAQRSPHYLDPDPGSTHMGETQEERITQFLEENEAPVVGLREGTMLRVEAGAVRLKGITSARIFRRGYAPVEAQPESNLADLLSAPTPGGRA